MKAIANDVAEEYATNLDYNRKKHSEISDEDVLLHSNSDIKVNLPPLDSDQKNKKAKKPSALSENAKQADFQVSSYEISGGTQSSSAVEPHVIAKNKV